jgi:BASS family bile acid:Na+ symporter
MKAVIQDVFSVLLAVLIPLASFSTGLLAPHRGRGETMLWRRPVQLFRDLLAILILVPAWVLALVLILPVTPLVRAGLVIATLAVGIGPMASMKRMGPAAPTAREALELNIVVLVISLAFVPLAFALLAALFHRALVLDVRAVAKVVLVKALIPLLLGLGAARLFPRFSASKGPMLMKIVNILLLVLVAIALLVSWRRMIAIGGVGWIVCAAAVAGSLVIGHLLGGPDPSSRSVVAAASVMRFPALALALASATYAGRRLMPVVLAYIILALLSVTLYGAIVGWWGRRKPVSDVTPLHVAQRTT